MPIPYDTFADDLKAFNRAAKTRATKYRNGKISTYRYMDGIYRDLRKCAADGKVHVYAILLAMYQETIVEMDGQNTFNMLVSRLARGTRNYQEQGSFLPFIPF